MSPVSRMLAGMLALGVGMLLSGCESTLAYLRFYKDGRKIDTGVVDYRYYDLAAQRFTNHFFPGGCVSPPPGTAPSGCLSTIDDRELLRAGDSVSVNLLYGFICDFYEQANTPRELARDYGETSKQVRSCNEIKENRAGTRGEIAVLTTAFERGGDKKIVYQPDAVGEKNARVVYYSDDIRETGQPLNMSNMPVYGPVSYGGKPFFIRLYVAELDEAESRETGAILRSLADLGAKSYPPASQVLRALVKVGDAFLESQQDDLLMQYDLILDGNGGITPVTAPLAAGIYVFVRTQDRLETFEWDRYCLDTNTGKLHMRDTGCNPSTGNEHIGETYFTIQVKRNEPALDHDLYQTFQEFTQVSQEKIADKSALVATLETLSAQVEKASAYDRARSMIPKLASSSPVEQRQAHEALANALCLGASDKTDEQRLSDDQVFYLLRLVETEAPGAKLDTTRLLDDRKALCGSSTTG